MSEGERQRCVEEEPSVTRLTSAVDHGAACHYAEEVEVITASDNQEEE